jgi:hypothetical protein
MGVASIVPVLKWYLKKDLRLDIFLLMDFEVRVFPLRFASQLRTQLWSISFSGIFPNCEWNTFFHISDIQERIEPVSGLLQPYCFSKATQHTIKIAAKL